jgi:hypothetical protein
MQACPKSDSGGFWAFSAEQAFFLSTPYRLTPLGIALAAHLEAKRRVACVIRDASRAPRCAEALTVSRP